MQLSLPQDCLAVFVDDTGHEWLNDPKQKVFGLGGCAIRSILLDTVVRKPWREVRRIVAGNPDMPLHAAKYPNPNAHQIDAVNDYFRLQPLPRFGAICSVETALDNDLTPVITVASSLKQRIADIGKWHPFSCVEIIFEHSRRLAPLIEAAFGDFELAEDGRNIPVGLSWMPKSAGEPALEVADFLVNAIGAEVRHRLAGRPGHAKNFQAFFHAADPRLVSFVDIRSATVQQRA